MRCNARFHSNFNSFCCNGLSRSAISCAVPTGGIRSVPAVKRFQPVTPLSFTLPAEELVPKIAFFCSPYNISVFQ